MINIEITVLMFTFQRLVQNSKKKMVLTFLDFLLTRSLIES